MIPDARALLPCPFCGGEAERYDDHDTGSINEGGSCITCKRCGASSPMHFERKENLISSWNDRVPSPPGNGSREKASDIIRKAAVDALFNGAGAIINPEIFDEAAEAILALSSPANIEPVAWRYFYSNGDDEEDAIHDWNLRFPPVNVGREVLAKTIMRGLDIFKPGADFEARWAGGGLWVEAAFNAADAILSLPAIPSDGVRQMVPEISFDPTNHHNALKCPYCNPKGQSFSEPSDGVLREALEELTGAMRFVLAFYEPQSYLDTNAWKNAEAGARAAFKKAEEALRSVPADNRAIIGGTNFCGHGVMASLCEICAHTPPDGPKP